MISHEFGTRIKGDSRKCVCSALEDAGMNFSIRRERLITASKGHFVPDRVALYRNDNNRYLGTVSFEYPVATNGKVFGALNPLVSESDWEVDRCGGFNEDRRAWMLLRQPFPSGLDHGATYHYSRTQMYLLASTTHNGTGALTITLTPYRIYCSNFINTAQSHADSCIRIPHNAKWSQRYRDAIRFVDSIPELTKRAFAVYRRMYETCMTKDTLTRWIKELPLSEARANALFIKELEAPGNYSAWDVYNVYNGSLNHEYRNRQRATNSLWFGQRGRRDADALSRLLYIAC